MNTFTIPGIGSWSPLTITSDAHGRDPRTIVHDLIGTGEPDVTFLPALTRSGTLELLTSGPADARAGVALLTAGYPLTLTADPTELSMRLVVTDQIDWRTDTDIDDRVVILRVPFREVPA